MTVHREHPEKFLLFGSPTISDDEVAEVAAVLRGGWLGRGPYVARFEQAFAQMKRVPEAVSVSSCSAALHLSLLVAGIKPGDEVITTPLTFCATVNAIIHAGATPVLADIDPETSNIDHRLIERAITKNTRAIVVVHFGGRPCEMDPVLALAAKHKLTIVEDCAHAIEAEYRGVPCGSLGDFGCFSFHATKNITTGEGGMILARSAENSAKLRRLSLHGLTSDAWGRYNASGKQPCDLLDVGFKYNMTDIEAALGLKQLAKIHPYWERRREISARYDRRLRQLPVLLSTPPPAYVKHAHHLYTMSVDPRVSGMDRDQFVEAMARSGVGVGVHYRSVAEYTVYRKLFGWNPADYPHALRVGGTTVSLPFSAKLTDADVDRVTGTIRDILTASPVVR